MNTNIIVTKASNRRQDEKGTSNVVDERWNRAADCDFSVKSVATFYYLDRSMCTKITKLNNLTPR